MKTKVFYINDGVYTCICCFILCKGRIWNPIHAKGSQKTKKKTKIPRVADEGWNSQKQLSGL